MKTNFLLLAICALMACNEPTDQADNKMAAATDNSSSAMAYFSGKIGEYPVFMSFTNGKEIDGQYRYTSSSSFLRIKGTKSEDGQYTLSEFNSKGVVTGVFKGKMDNDGAFTGFWENQLKDAPKLYFEMEPIDQNTYNSLNKLDGSQINTAQNNPSSELNGDSYSGNYELLVGSSDSPTGSISWNFTFRGADFSYEGRCSEECGGQIAKGTGRLVSTNVGEGVGKTEEYAEGWEEENIGTCRYNFKFSSKAVEVQQTDCGDMNFNCYLASLEGTIPRVTQK